MVLGDRRSMKGVGLATNAATNARGGFGAVTTRACLSKTSDDALHASAHSVLDLREKRSPSCMVSYRK